MKVGLLCSSSAATTLGLEIVADAVREAHPEWHVEPVDETTAKDISADFGVTPSNISAIATGKSWRWLA